MQQPDRNIIYQQVKQALGEDIGTGDITAQLLPEGQVIKVEILTREAMVLCGKAWVDAVFSMLHPAIQLKWLAEEGQWLESPQTLVCLQGPARALLSGERVALNFLQTLSATATQTRRYVTLLKDTGCSLLDTRKTLPGFRYAQKYAVACGGGYNHRMGLFDAFLIKENHIAACGSIAAAVAKARSQQLSALIEVEVESLEELSEVLPLKPDRIMLDNFTIEQLEQAVRMNSEYACQLEASGGINLDNLREVALTGVDFISVGAITKSINAIDLSMRVREVIECL